MSKNILIISTSLRFNSNSDLLAQSFEKGALEAGHLVERVTLRDKTIQFCKGCLSCVKTQKCVIHDDVNEIVDNMKEADVLVFSTPIYYYEMCGQMKTLLDRANPLFNADYKFRDIYFIASAAEDGDHVWTKAVNGLEGWIDCFEKSHLSGVVFAGGVTDPGEIQGYQSLKRAFEMGKNIR